MTRGLDTFRVLCIGHGRGVAYASDEDDEEEEIDADETPKPVFTDDCEGDYDRDGDENE